VGVRSRDPDVGRGPAPRKAAASPSSSRS
jgi:hypothetical protein